jgi:hypothetical protein
MYSTVSSTSRRSAALLIEGDRDLELDHGGTWGAAAASTAAAALVALQPRGTVERELDLDVLTDQALLNALPQHRQRERGDDR